MNKTKDTIYRRELLEINIWRLAQRMFRILMWNQLRRSQSESASTAGCLRNRRLSPAPAVWTTYRDTLLSASSRRWPEPSVFWPAEYRSGPMWDLSRLPERFNMLPCLRRDPPGQRAESDWKRSANVNIAGFVWHFEPTMLTKALKCIFLAMPDI